MTTPPRPVDVFYVPEQDDAVRLARDLAGQGYEEITLQRAGEDGWWVRARRAASDARPDDAARAAERRSWAETYDGAHEATED